MRHDYGLGNEVRLAANTIPAGFFSQPDAEHISAVIANPSGTHAKFDRIGFLAGFGDPKVAMFREGMCFVDSSDTSQEFSVAVHSPGSLLA